MLVKRADAGTTQDPILQVTPESLKLTNPLPFWQCSQTMFSLELDGADLISLLNSLCTVDTYLVKNAYIVIEFLPNTQ